MSASRPPQSPSLSTEARQGVTPSPDHHDFLYTVPGVAKLLKRHHWSVQVPLRRAVERDEQGIEAWKDEG